jgi:predicted amidohydrolase
MNKVSADRLAIAVAQLNPIVGDVSGNLERARIARAEAARDGAEIVAFSELFIAGYPPEDLVLKPAFQAACRAAVETLARRGSRKRSFTTPTPCSPRGASRRSASRSTCRTTACSTRSASLRPDQSPAQ